MNEIYDYIIKYNNLFKMDKILFSEENENNPEKNTLDNDSSNKVNEQNQFNTNLINSLSSNDIKTTIINIFKYIYQSEKSNLYNKEKKI